MVKLSVITINLNNAKGLVKTIKSVIEQTYLDYEYIIIDGGSSDNSIDIINEYKDKFSYSVSEPDSGIYQAMNKGIQHAGGEYCFFLNSGDQFASGDVLKNIFNENSDADVIFGRLIICNKDNSIIGRTKGKSDISLIDVYDHTLKHQASFIKRELFNKYGLYNESLRIISDWEFFMKSVGLGDASVKYIDIDIAFFDNDGISHNSPELCISERQTTLQFLLPARVNSDYVTFSKLYPYKRVLDYKLSWLLLRIINKTLKIYERVFINTKN